MKWRTFVAGWMLLQAAVVATAEEITLNFKDTDLQTVTEMVSKITGKNFIIDPRVKGNVTVISSAPLDADSLYSIFLSILRVHGFVAVDDGTVVKILPAASAREEAPVARDSAESDEILVEVLPVRHVPAAQMVPILRPLVEKEGHLAAHTNSNTLIVAASRRTVSKIGEMLTALDRATDTEIETIPLRYAPADEMVRTLQALDTSRRGKGGEAPEDLAAAIVADNRTNSLIVSGNAGYRERIGRLVRSLDREIRDRRDVHVVYLRFAKAVDLAPIVEKIAVDRAEAAAQGGEGQPVSVAATGATRVTVQPDEQTNSLIITAQPDTFRDMDSVIRKLDIRRAQVLVEALIVEVNEDKAADFGVQWIGVSNDLNVSAEDLVRDVPLSAGTLIGVLTTGDFTFGALAKALDQDADANIVSTPSLLTLDNQEAEIVVGREIPFVTGSYTGVGNSTLPSNPFQTIQRENVGLTLKITPRISEGDAIHLAIDQQLSNVLPGAADLINSVDVVTSTRNIKTNVIIDDGSILVLGGLIDDVVRESESRVPLVGDIPIVGWAFRYRTVEAQKRNLMIFIRPKILRSPVSNLSATEEKYNRVREQQLDRYGRGVELLPEASQPVLDPLGPKGRAIEGPPVLPAEVPDPDRQAGFDIQDYGL